MVRHDVAEAAVAVLERQFRSVPRHRRALTTERMGCNHRTLRPPTAEAVHNIAREVQQVHPVPGTGRYERVGGMQPAQLRGAGVAPSRPGNHPPNCPPAPGLVDPLVLLVAGTSLWITTFLPQLRARRSAAVTQPTAVSR